MTVWWFLVDRNRSGMLKENQRNKLAKICWFVVVVGQCCLSIVHNESTYSDAKITCQSRESTVWDLIVCINRKASRGMLAACAVAAQSQHVPMATWNQAAASEWECS